jgi:hypothetical protein
LILYLAYLEEGRSGRNKRQAIPDPCFEFDHEVKDGKDSS